ncbi:sigma E regulatory protein, MucB/RseB [Congregibacter litoralis KT71]|uniref:Sigma E regulatory protein, MucB/RseB n=1 Tax=Congregibacter litoralis KT71 TaxID=314285 RepID=A4A3V1_9GAMM|nr:sigma E regulatory protein, MucB/RseB [Congregibacter litoralis KT71]
MLDHSGTSSIFKRAFSRSGCGPCVGRPSDFARLSYKALTGALLSLAAAFTLAQPQCDALAPSVARLLQAMSSNAQRGNYSGVVTLQRGNDMQIMELSHRVENGQASEELSRLTGQDALVERTDHPTDCMHPGHQLLRSAEIIDGSFCGLASVYRFRVQPGDRIAGRASLRLRVEPKDMYRFGHVLELDQDTALILKSSTFAADQSVLEQFQFASISMAPRQPADAVVEYEATHPHPHESEHLRRGVAWDLAWLPEGFMPTDSVPKESQRKSYTDGLASFSVFLEPLGAAIKPGEGVERQGSTVAYTRGTLLDRRPVLVTVLGEIPTNTARMLADSVRLQ